MALFADLQELTYLEASMVDTAEPFLQMIEELLEDMGETAPVPSAECGLHQPDPVAEIEEMLQPHVHKDEHDLIDPDLLPTTLLEKLLGTEEFGEDDLWCNPYGPDPLQDIINVLLGETVEPPPASQEPWSDDQLVPCPPSLPSVLEFQPQAWTSHLCSQQDEVDSSNMAPQTFPHNKLENSTPVGTMSGELVYSFSPEAFTPVFLPAAAAPLNIPPTRKRNISRQKERAEQPYIKKPPNAFMLFRQEQRSNIVAELNVTNCAVVNTELGKRWRDLPEKERQKYFKEAETIRLHHEQQYPDWSTSDNYGKKRKRIRTKRPVPMTTA